MSPWKNVMTTRQTRDIVWGLFFFHANIHFCPAATFCRTPDRQFSCWEAGRLGSVWMDPFEKWVLNFQRGNVSESRNVWPSDKSFRFCKQKTFFFEVQSFVGGEFWYTITAAFLGKGDQISAIFQYRRTHSSLRSGKKVRHYCGTWNLYSYSKSVWG